MSRRIEERFFLEDLKGVPAGAKVIFPELLQLFFGLDARPLSAPVQCINLRFHKNRTTVVGQSSLPCFHEAALSKFAIFLRLHDQADGRLSIRQLHQLVVEFVPLSFVSRTVVTLKNDAILLGQKTLPWVF